MSRMSTYGRIHHKLITKLVTIFLHPRHSNVYNANRVILLQFSSIREIIRYNYNQLVYPHSVMVQCSRPLLHARGCQSIAGHCCPLCYCSQCQKDSLLTQQSLLSRKMYFHVLSSWRSWRNKRMGRRNDGYEYQELMHFHFLSLIPIVCIDTILRR